MRTAFESFIEPARPTTAIWRPIVGLGLITIGIFAWALLIVIAFSLFNSLNGMSFKEALDAGGELADSTDSKGLIFLSSAFVAVWISVWLVARFLHRQDFSTLIAPRHNFRLRDVVDGFLLAIVFWLATTIPVILVYGMPDRSALPLANWIIMLAPMIVALAFQSGAEELLFRGYLLQQLAARWQSPVVWAGVTSFLFATYHWSGNLFYNVYLLVGGLVFVSLVWRTGSLMMSIGFHLGINLFTFNAAGYNGVKFNDSQLFKFQGTEYDIVMIINVVTMSVILFFILSPIVPQRSSAEWR